MISTSRVLEDILGKIGSGVMVYDLDNQAVLFENLIAKNSEENGRVLLRAVKSVTEDGEVLIPKRPAEYFDAESGLWFDVAFSKLEWIDGREVLLLTSTDTTLKKKTSTRNAFVAQNDSLTGLFNRMKCEMDLRKIIDNAVRTNRKGAVILIDLDNFKNINESLGYDYGNVLLKEIAIELRSGMGRGSRCYRMSGDEFALIVNPEYFDSLNVTLKMLNSVFNKQWCVMDSNCYCTTSMGVVIFPDNGTDVNDLVKKADMAMHRAKQTGKNQYVLYSDELDVEVSYKRLRYESSMRQAVEQNCNEFVLFYQPIIEAASGKCTGCEALIRWNSKALGFVSPGEFIPLAEYLGLIVEIGDYVLEVACAQCKKWNDMYDPDFRVNVNLSIVQLMKQNVVEKISGIIRNSGVNPANITLEITENLAINDMDRVNGIIQGLKALGVNIALDDFGTGYSSLNYVKKLNFDIIKIDKSFIDGLETEEYERAFIKLIVDFAKQIDTKLCAEGIETKEQFEILKAMQVDTIQGFYFSRPIPSEEFEKKFLIGE